MTRKKIIIISVIGLVIIGAIVALLLVNENFLTGSKPAENGNINAQNNNANNQLPTLTDVEGPVKPALNSTEQTIFFSARNFSERFGSFSSDSAGQNINELKSLTTADLFKNLQAEADNKTTNGFYSISSKALKVDILTANEDEAGSAELAEANVMVSLQRSEVKDNKEPFIFNQNLELKLVKSGDKWVVSEVNWQ